MEKRKILESILFVINSIIGTSLTIEDVSNWVGLVILIFQAFLLLYGIITKIHNNIKHGKIEDNDKLIEQGIKQLEDLKKGRDDDGN